LDGATAVEPLLREDELVLGAATLVRSVVMETGEDVEERRLFTAPSEYRLCEEVELRPALTELAPEFPPELPFLKEEARPVDVRLAPEESLPELLYVPELLPLLPYVRPFGAYLCDAE
jgi:hypothetical protein